jgi:hypothetical protein
MSWTEPDRAASVRQAAIAVAKFAATSPDLEVRPQVRRELLTKYVLWLVSTGTIAHKHDTRYRSAGAVGVTDPAELVHEHVHTRRQLADLILANPTDEVIEFIINHSAFGCVVTRDEHTRLSPFDRTHTGWGRYKAAGIEVIDMSTGEALELDAETYDD